MITSREQVVNPRSPGVREPLSRCASVGETPGPLGLGRCRCLVTRFRRWRSESPGHELDLSSSTDPTSLIGQFNPEPRAICGELFDVQQRELHRAANAAPRGSARLMLRYANATSSSRAPSPHSSVSLPAPRHVACPGRRPSDTWPSTTAEAAEYAAASPTAGSLLMPEDCLRRVGAVPSDGGPLSVRRTPKVFMVLASGTSRRRAPQGASEGVLVSGSSSSACRSRSTS
jgi:hypothetical protein